MKIKKISLQLKKKSTRNQSNLKEYNDTAISIRSHLNKTKNKSLFQTHNQLSSEVNNLSTPKHNISIKMPQLYSFQKLSLNIREKEIKKKNLYSFEIDSYKQKSFKRPLKIQSRNTHVINNVSNCTASFDSNPEIISTSKSKFFQTAKKDIKKDNNSFSNKLLLANLTTGKNANIDKAKLRRFSIVDKLLFKIMDPDGVIEDYYRNNDSRPGDKYALFKRQLVKERNRLNGLMNDIKKTQSMNESMLKVYMFRLNYTKIKALTRNLNNNYK